MRLRASILLLALAGAGACTEPLAPDAIEGRWGLASVAGEPLPFHPPPDVALGWALLADTLSFAPDGVGERVTTVQETVAGDVRVRVDSGTFSWRLEGHEVVIRSAPCPPGTVCAALGVATLRFTVVGDHLAYFEDGTGPFAYQSAGHLVLPLVR